MGLSFLSNNQTADLKKNSLRSSSHFPEALHLCASSVMTFHWFDALETSKRMISRLSVEVDLEEELKKSQKILDRLHLIPLWIRSEQKIFQMTMYQLYEDYIIDFKKNLIPPEQKKGFEISFISAGGPYREMNMNECFHESTYLEFYKYFILKERIVPDEFSLRLKCRILLEFGKNFQNASLIELKKLTTEGIYLSMDKNFYQDQFTSSDQVRPLIQSGVLLKTLGKGLEDIQLLLAPHELNLFYTSSKKDSFILREGDYKLTQLRDSFTPGKIDLFLSYEVISSQNRELAENLKRFITHIRPLVLSHYPEQNLLSEAS